MARILVERPHRGFVVGGVEEHAAHPVLRDLQSMRGVEPQLVLPDRTAERRIDVSDFLQRVRRREAARLQVGSEVAALHRLVGERREDQAAEGVAALLRNDVHAHAALGGFRRHAGRVNRHLLRAAHVGHVRRVVHAGGQHQRQAVDRRSLIEAAAPVRGELRDRVAAAAADILRTDAVERQTSGDADAGKQHPEVLHEPARRHRVDHAMIEHLLTRGALDVDDRRFAADGDRLRDRADTQIRVDGRGERAVQLNAVAPDRAEARQRERHRVGAGPQVDDLVLAGAVGDDRSRLLDQRGTGCFNGHARQHGAGRIADAARNGSLGSRNGRNDDDRREYG